MGGEYWEHWAPYNENIEIVVQTLQKKVINDGDFRNYESFIQFDKEKEILNLKEQIAECFGDDSDYSGDDYYDYLINQIQFYESYPIEPELSDKIKLAVFLAAEESTASILDFYAFSDEFDFCKIKILNEKELIKLFNNIKPSKSQIIEKRSDIAELVPERLQGLCICAYDSDNPIEYYFAGYSAD